jgi:hypothetical protein
LGSILKWPVIVGAIVVVLRIVAERAGAPSGVSNAVSIVAVHTLLAPVYFAIVVGKKGLHAPYVTLLKLIALYVVIARAMVLPTYWLARVYQWPESRFAGTWGPDVTPFDGFIGVPFLTAGLWILGSIVFGGFAGSIILTLTRRSHKPRRG